MSIIVFPVEQAQIVSRETLYRMIRQFTSKTQQIGLKGEEFAAAFLVKQGFEILGCNIHNRHGEIDIAASRQQTAYFFEVKAGMQGSWFNPADNLSKRKLWKLFRAVEYYCLEQGIKEYCIQGILVLLPQNGKGEANVEIIDLS